MYLYTIRSYILLAICIVGLLLASAVAGFLVGSIVGIVWSFAFMFEFADIHGFMLVCGIVGAAVGVVCFVVYTLLKKVEIEI